MRARRVGMQRELGTDSKSRDSLVNQWMRIAAVVCAYWFISISMVFLNKYLLSSKTLKLDAPLFITLSQCVVAVVVFLCLSVSSKRYEFITFPEIDFSIATLVKVMPLSIIFVSMITFNNLTLKFLGVAFYNVGRSLTTVFNVVFSYAVLGQTVSCQTITCCGIIVFGFLLGLKEEHASITSDDDSNTNFSIFGVICGVLASLSVALYAIYTKRILPIVDNNIWRLQVYNNANALILLFPLLFVMGEWDNLRHFKFWWYSTFWGLMVTTGVFGIAIGYITALQIQVTSPLTHNVSGTAKAGAQTVLACLVYSEVKQFWWWVSNVMVLAGSSAYTYVRMSEMKKENSSTNDRGDGGTVVGGGGTVVGGGGGGGAVNKTLRIMEEDSESGVIGVNVTSKP